jgi:hypothetical protein
MARWVQLDFYGRQVEDPVLQCRAGGVADEGENDTKDVWLLHPVSCWIEPGSPNCVEDSLSIIAPLLPVPLRK